MGEVHSKVVEKWATGLTRAERAGLLAAYGATLKAFLEGAEVPTLMVDTSALIVGALADADELANRQ